MDSTLIINHQSRIEIGSGINGKRKASYFKGYK